ncbi:MAG TPA: dipeptidase [Longimicrobiales bacterium]|nr:dipeptidase [Longimicrobiales bacterium]
MAVWLAAPRPAAAQERWAPPDSALLRQARELLESAPLIDGHNDLPSRLLELYGGAVDSVDFAGRQPRLPADLPRLRAGRVGAQFWAANPRIDPALGAAALRNGLQGVDVVHRLVARYPDLELARTADDIERITRSGKIACLIAMEGGHAIASSLAALRALYALDVRYLTLTHDRTTDWADASTDFPRHQGLTPFGREVVLEMNRLGMFVDLSHTSDETAEEVLRISRAPVLFSHSNARSVNPHPRNLPDRLLRMVAGNGGVVMVNFVAGYVAPTARPWAEWCRARGEPGCAPTGRGIDEPLWSVRRDSVAQAARLAGRSEKDAVAEWTGRNPAPRGTVADVADHIDHIRRVAGIDHVGIGSDFFDPGGPSMAAGLEDAGAFPNLFAELLRRGYSKEDLRKIAGQNLLRAMRQMEAVARRLQASEPPRLDVAVTP